MPVLIVIAGYVAWIWRQPIDRRLKQHRTGPIIIGLGVLAVLALWIQYQPAGISLPYLTGDLAGVCSVYLMAVTMILAARSRRLEIWFGGVDAIYLWHKRTAYAAFVLLFPHWLITGTGAPGITRDQLTSTIRAGALLGQVSLLALIALVLISIPRVGKIIHQPGKTGTANGVVLLTSSHDRHRHRPSPRSHPPAVGSGGWHR
jgi:hypothetical protein